MKRNHDQATKTAVIAALVGKQPAKHIAHLYTVPVRTVYLWRSEAIANGTLAADSPATEAAAPAEPRASLPRPVREQASDNDRDLRTALKKVAILRQALAIALEGQV